MLQHLEHLNQLPRLFLACSGGRDSLSLAYACFLLHQQGRLERLPTLLHVHHGIQKVNDDWATLIKNWADKHGFMCHVLYLNLGKASETLARSARYQAMAELMADGDVLLLAHHKNDQAETVLMRLMMGAGVAGLSGIKAWQTRQLAGKTICLHRPWLSVSRSDISNFAHMHQLDYVDDPTNDTGDNARSVIRTHILPQLSALNPKATSNIARSAQNLADSAHILHKYISAQLHRCLSVNETDPPYQSVLLLDKLQQFEPQEQSAMIHQWLQGDEPLPADKHTVDNVLALAHRLNGDHQTEIFWRGKRFAYTICRYQHKLYRYLHTIWTSLNTPDKISLITDNLWQLKHKPALIYQAPTGLTLIAHTRQDKLHIQGNHLKGKKLYQKLKIAPWLRHNLWLACQDGTPVLLIAPYQCWQLTNLSPMTHGARWQFCTS